MKKLMMTMCLLLSYVVRASHEGGESIEFYRPLLSKSAISLLYIMALVQQERGINPLEPVSLQVSEQDLARVAMQNAFMQGFSNFMDTVLNDFFEQARSEDQDQSVNSDESVRIAGAGLRRMFGNNNR